jgi:hypothetical protein
MRLQTLLNVAIELLQAMNNTISWHIHKRKSMPMQQNQAMKMKRKNTWLYSIVPKDKEDHHRLECSKRFKRICFILGLSKF